MVAVQVVQGYNADPAVHGILVQLPLPKHINEQRILDAVSFEKDVDGFHPQNIGCLAMRTRDPLFICCTPKVIIPMQLRFCHVTMQCVPQLITVAPAMHQCHTFAMVCCNAESKPRVCCEVYNARQLKEL